MSKLVPYLPFLMATAGLAVVLARDRLESRLAAAVAPYSDLVWCGVLLLAKTSLLYAQLDGHNESRVPWLDLALAATALGLLVLVKYTIRIWLVFATALTASIWTWGDLIHYRFFKDVASAAALQATGNAAAIGASVVALAERVDLWLFIDLLPALAMTILLARESGGSRRPVLSRQTAIALLVLVGLATPGVVHYGRMLATPQNARKTHVFRNRWLVAEYGLAGFHIWDARQGLGRLFTPMRLKDDDLEDVRQWFADTRSRRAGTEPWFGFSEGRTSSFCRSSRCSPSPSKSGSKASRSRQTSIVAPQNRL